MPSGAIIAKDVSDGICSYRINPTESGQSYEWGMAEPDLAAENLAGFLRKEATALAGSNGSLVQRASVYHHMFEHSGCNHTFPLLAAHGALWAKGYFQRGMRFGAAVAWCRVLMRDDRHTLMQSLDKFADDFRDINRRVCVETYFIYHLTANPRLAGIAESRIPPDLLEQMARCHTARRANRIFSDHERRSLFTAFFLWEQKNIVGPAVERAFNNFHWAIIKALALKPSIQFSYFRPNAPLIFENFTDMNERIERGLAAFDLASRAGWAEVKAALDLYGIMPDAFRENPARHFLAVARETVGPPIHTLAASA